MKKILGGLLIMGTLIGCGQKDEAKVLTFSTWEGTGEQFFMDINDINTEYKKINPNVTIKIEKIPNTEYDTTMKIRNTAKQLPDIFAIRNKHMYSYRDAVHDLSDLNASKINTFAEPYKINGKVVGLPMYGFNEYVYYRKSVFNKLGLEVPQTWNEFLGVVEKINSSSDLIPLAIGGKDLWTTYPYGQFVPYLVENGDNLLNQMGDMNSPFSEGTSVYKGYEKVNQLFKLKPAGENPLGYGWSQEKNMFLSGKSAMIAVGQWFYKDFMKDASEEDKNDLGMFLMPVRDTKDDKFRYFVTGEVFLGVPKSTKHEKEAKEFIEWFFASNYYKDYINYMQVIPTVEGVELTDSPFKAVTDKVENLQAVYQIPGGENYTKIKNETRYDQNQLSQELLSGSDFKQLMEEWNKKWNDAKGKVVGR